jgi:hypothetical protein
LAHADHDNGRAAVQGGVDDPTQRTIEALENIALELERLRLFKEHELGVVVEDQPDPHVRRLEREADEE